MSGLTNLLNIAKVGLLAQQTSLQTIGHNISNVNTPGYSKQSVTLAAKDPTPTFIGPMGNGVDAVEVTRAYDRFITSTLFAKNSELSGLETRLSGLKTVESLFNEVEDNGLNGLIEDFWQGWDDLANNAEGTAERTTLVQRATMLTQAVRDKYQNLMALSKDIDLNIQSSVDDINNITKQIADLNVQIVSAESGHHSANDLRDQRDELLKRLSQLADVRYFETERGSYTVMIGQGSPLVEDNKSWDLKIIGGDVTWLGTNGQQFKLTTTDISSGELGGWLDIKSKLKPRDVTELTNSVVNTAGNEAIHLDTLFSDIDGVNVTGQFSISFSGTDQTGAGITGTYDSDDDVDGDGVTGTIRDFAAFIENSFNNNVQVTTTEDGRIKIEDINPGEHPISFQIDSISGGITGLNLGKFDNNYPLSYTERLNQIAQQLIKEVNKQHAQGVGLIPLQEATASNSVLNPDEPLESKASGLEFSEDVQDGSFQIWLFDPDGNVIDQDAGTPRINEPVTITIDENTTLTDLADQINNITGLNARILNGSLVIGVDETSGVGGFAFGKDTSNVLMALGLNSFFTGTGANDIQVNSDLVNDPRLVAAAQVEEPGVVSVTSKQVTEPARVLGLSIDQGSFSITFDGLGGAVTRTINVNKSGDNPDSLRDILNKIEDLDEVKRAWVEEGTVHIETETGYEITQLEDSASEPTHFFEYTGLTLNGSQTRLDGTLAVDRTFDPITAYDTNVVDGTLTLVLYDENGVAYSTVDIDVDSDVDTLEDIRDKIDAQNDLKAVIENGRLQISAAGNADSFAISDDSSGLTEYLAIQTPPGGRLSPANNQNALAMKRLSYQPIGELDDATISDAYHSLVGTVGIDTRTVNLDYDFMRGAVNDLQARREDVSGVSIDEELSDLLKYQHAYTAAAKLIKVADELFVSLLQSK